MGDMKHYSLRHLLFLTGEKKSPGFIGNGKPRGKRERLSEKIRNSGQQKC